jgi:hypothetical protein
MSQTIAEAEIDRLRKRLRGVEQEALQLHGEVATLRHVIEYAYDVAQEMSHDDHQALVCVLEVLEPVVHEAGKRARR